MNKEQINEAARNHSHYALAQNGFEKGVEWALSQPKDIESLREEWNKRSDYIKKSKNVDTEEIWNMFEPHLHPKEQPKESDEDEATKKFCPFCKNEVSRMSIFCKNCDSYLIPN